MEENLDDLVILSNEFVRIIVTTRAHYIHRSEGVPDSRKIYTIMLISNSSNEASVEQHVSMTSLRTGPQIKSTGNKAQQEKLTNFMKTQSQEK